MVCESDGKKVPDAEAAIKGVKVHDNAFILNSVRKIHAEADSYSSFDMKSYHVAAKAASMSILAPYRDSGGETSAVGAVHLQADRLFKLSIQCTIKGSAAGSSKLDRQSNYSSR
eukprot:6455640-Amphidinium_carterae.1